MIKSGGGLGYVRETAFSLGAGSDFHIQLVAMSPDTAQLQGNSDL